MKKILTLGAVMMFTAFSFSQVYQLHGQLIDVLSNTHVKVYQQDSKTNCWAEIDQMDVFGPVYSVELQQGKSYQVWFTDIQQNTKVLSIDSGVVINSSFQMDVDFNVTGSVQLGRDEKGYYTRHIGTDFMPLNEPFDLFGL